MTNPATNPQARPEPPDLITGNRELNTYLRTMTGAEDGLLGNLVIYNVSDVDEVTLPELRNWFAELELDGSFLPGEPRAIDAYEKATSGAKLQYPLGPIAGKRKRNKTATGETVTLMMRAIYRDETRIVRHLVRELADHDNEALSYEVKLAEAEFIRATDPALPIGSGDMTLMPDDAEIDKLTDDERTTIHDLITQMHADYEKRKRNVAADRLRKVLRDYIEQKCGAVRIHAGVYFVPRQYSPVLASLRTLAARFRGELTRVPLHDTAEERHMVDGAFEAKARADLESLARDMAREQADPKGYRVRLLHKRFLEVKKATEEYQDTLDTQLTETEAGIALAEAQMASLFMALGEQDGA